MAVMEPHSFPRELCAGALVTSKNVHGGKAIRSKNDVIRVEHTAHRGSTRLTKCFGTVEIALGVICCTCHVIGLLQPKTHESSDNWAFDTGFGIWVSTMYILTGGLTTAWSVHVGQFLVRCSVVMSVLSSVVSVAGIGLASVSIALENQHRDTEYSPRVILLVSWLELWSMVIVLMCLSFSIAFMCQYSKRHRASILVSEASQSRSSSSQNINQPVPDDTLTSDIATGINALEECRVQELTREKELFKPIIQSDSYSFENGHSVFQFPPLSRPDVKTMGPKSVGKPFNMDRTMHQSHWLWNFLSYLGLLLLAFITKPFKFVNTYFNKYVK